MASKKPKIEALDPDDLNLVTLAQQYSDEGKARALLESLRWPDGPVCPHCKNHKEKAIYTLKPNKASHRPGRKGLYKCGACRKQFTVTVGTIFEDSHSREHLPKYANEFAFRWNNRVVTDGKRMVNAIAMTEGKRLTYRQAV